MAVDGVGTTVDQGPAAGMAWAQVADHPHVVDSIKP
jgi:hypothetical protein